MCQQCGRGSGEASQHVRETQGNVDFEDYSGGAASKGQDGTRLGK